MILLCRFQDQVGQEEGRLDDVNNLNEPRDLKKPEALEYAHAPSKLDGFIREEKPRGPDRRLRNHASGRLQTPKFAGCERESEKADPERHFMTTVIIRGTFLAPENNLNSYVCVL